MAMVKINNKGVALIACFLVLVPLMILSAAFFARSINEKNLIQIQQRRTQAFYLAQRGLEYAYFEIVRHPFTDWVTHQVQGNDPNYALIPANSIPTVILSSICRIENASGPNFRCYVPIDINQSGDFAVKVYPDPFKTDESIIISRGTDSTVSVTLIQKVNTASLYKYFIFTPNHLIMDNTDYNGGATLKHWIHANGDVIFRDNVSVTNVGHFDTAVKFMYDYIGYVPPENWPNASLAGSNYNSWGGDDLSPDPISGSIPAVYWQFRWPWYEPYFRQSINAYPVNTITDQHFYYNNPDGFLYGCTPGVPQRQETAIPGQQPAHDPALVARINNVIIPNRFDHARYDINKYLPIPSTAQGVTQGDSADVTVNYLNSEEQHSEWQSFLSQNGLSGMLKDGLEGVEGRVPLQMNLYNLVNMAQEDGFYIRKSDFGLNEIQGNLNGQSFAGMQPPVSNFVTVRNIFNTNSGRMNEVIMINVGAMMASGNAPHNGIIYCDINTLIHNAEELPEGGLSIISIGNLYLRGDYNTINYQPSCGMSPKLFYFLSDNFNITSPPQTARATLHHMEWPYAEGEPGQLGYYAERSDFTPNFSNWFSSQELNMPNRVLAGHQYFISLVGPNALRPQSLERWQYWDDPGSIILNPSTIPNNWVARFREIHGAFIVLPTDNFLPNYQYGNLGSGTSVIGPYPVGNCNNTGGIDWPQARDDNYGIHRDNNGWPENMTSIGPQREQLFYEEGYFTYEDGVPRLPPEEGLGFKRGAWQEVGDFNHHDIFISKIEDDYLGPIIPNPE